MSQLASGTQQSDCLKTNEPPQQRQVLAPMGSDDIITSEELEQAEDDSLPDATPGHDDAKNENENKELSHNLIEESETQLEPEKEKEKEKEKEPEKEKEK